jgi:2-polyprenyl-6-methoxyphenol hydroxylase-like FAD-dependent oxidoreductase
MALARLAPMSRSMPRALIIGGSLGGLFAGLLLRQVGWEVTVFERSSGDLASRGAGIGTHVEQFDIMRRLGIVVDESIGVAVKARICLGRDGAVVARLPFEKILTSWALFYRALRRHFPDAHYRAGMQLEDVAQRADSVTATFGDGTRADGDLLVGADGLYSTVRARVFGGPAPSYAGDIAWRGRLDERALPAIARADLLDTDGFFLSPREMLLSYWQPGIADDARPGRRRLNWMWYHPLPAGEMADLMTDAAGRHHEAGIPPPLIRPDVIAAFRKAARDILPPQYVAVTEATPAPFLQPIFDLDSPRIVKGRVVLLGDAAHVARPHVGAGVSKAALSAAWLADALTAARGDIDAALAAHEKRALAFGAAMVARARYLGAYLERPSRAGLEPDPMLIMQAIGAPLRDIPQLEGKLFDYAGR